MEHATSTDSGQLTVQQMFATLLGEIASLRKQNEDQQRQLEHLRADMSSFLERSQVSSQSSRTFPFRRLPLEVREMIWELAVPSRLLGFEGLAEEGLVPSAVSVPTALSVPTVAHVCRESRRVVTSRKSVTTLTGRSTHLDGPSQLWRLEYTKTALWTWFTPYKDAMLINPHNFKPYEREKRNQRLVQATEHIVVDGDSLWYRFYEGNIEDDDVLTLKRLSTWVQRLVPEPEYTLGAREPVYNLRTIDFAMSNVTKIDRTYPPNFVRRLFAEDRVRIVDLRDKEAVRGIESLLYDEFSKVMDPSVRLEWHSDLEMSSFIFAAAADKLFPHVRASLLSELARSYHQESVTRRLKSQPVLPSPFKGDELDMEVTWVEELTKRISIRPVHVFVRADGI